jgi:hypothetical protein
MAGMSIGMAACDKAKRKAGISPGFRLFSVVEDTQTLSTYTNFDSESIDFAGVVVLV